MNGCLYDRWFDLEWDEEVLLSDGRVIVVHLKQTYERLSQSLSRYGGDEPHTRYDVDLRRR